MQQNKIYREEALKRISSPDQLKGYIRTSGPGVWFVLSAVLLALIGIIFWGVNGTFEVTVEVTGGTYDGNSACFVHPSDRALITEGMQVRYLTPNKETYTGIIATIDDNPMTYHDACEKYTDGVARRMGFTLNSELYRAKLIMNSTPKNNWATVRIVRKVVRPIDLLLGAQKTNEDVIGDSIGDDEQ